MATLKPFYLGLFLLAIVLVSVATAEKNNDKDGQDSEKELKKGTKVDGALGKVGKGVDKDMSFDKRDDGKKSN